MDFSTFNWLGFALAIVANIVIGFVWYAPWFPTGAAWMRYQGIDPKKPGKPTGMAVSMLLMILGSALMMFVFAHTNGVYLDAFRNTATGGKAGYHLSLMDGLMGGFFTWLGFIVPINLNRVAFEKGKWGFFGINVGYYLVALLVAGTLIALVGGK